MIFFQLSRLLGYVSCLIPWRATATTYNQPPPKKKTTLEKLDASEAETKRRFLALHQKLRALRLYGKTSQGVSRSFFFTRHNDVAHGDDSKPMAAWPFKPKATAVLIFGCLGSFFKHLHTHHAMDPNIITKNVSHMLGTTNV